MNAIFNLRFLEGVKENFANFYKKELDQVAKILKDDQAELDQIEKDIDQQLANIDKYIKKIDDENKQIESDPEGYFKQIKNRLAANIEEMDSMVKDPKKREILNKVQDPSSNPTLSELQLYNQYLYLKEKINEDQTKALYSSSPANLISLNNMYKGQKVQALNSSKENLKLLKEGKIWMPTAANLKSHSRKEQKENIHRMSAVLTAGNLPRKTRLALEWAVSAQDTHFTHFQNPFEWHEVTARVTTPAYPVSLAQRVYVPQTAGLSFGTELFGPSTQVFALPRGL